MFNRFQTIICSLHDVDLALKYFHRIIGIKDGAIILDKISSLINKEDTNKLYNDFYSTCGYDSCFVKGYQI